MILCAIGTILVGLTSDGIVHSLQGFVTLQTHAARLINDYTVIGGVGAALFNAGLMGLLTLILIKVSGVSLSGPTVAAFFTIMGFSLFGKTPFNTTPIILGVFSLVVWRESLLKAIFLSPSLVLPWDLW